MDGLRLVPQDADTLQALAQQVQCWARTPAGKMDPRVRLNTCWTKNLWVPAEVCAEYGAPPFTSKGAAITCPSEGDGQVPWYIMATDVEPLNPATCTSENALPTPTAVTPGTPTDTSVTVAWGAVTGAVAYQVQYRVAGAATWTDVTPNPTTNSAELTGLTPNTAYEVRVRAVAADPVDNSAYSTAVAFATTLTPLAAPANLAAATPTATTIPLTWDAVTGAVGYVVRWRLDGATTWTTRAQVAGTTDTITGLTASTDYEVQVQAVGNGTTAGNSAFAPATPLAVSTTA